MYEVEGFWWNISDFDGEGLGFIGILFRYDRVGVILLGVGFGVGICVKIWCKCDEVCFDSY